MSMTLTFNPTDMIPIWKSFNQALPTPLSPIRNERQYRQMRALLNKLIDVVGNNQEHELFDFLDLIGQLIEDYENEYHKIPGAKPREVLRFLMEQHDMKQSDLASDFGSQSIVSEVLSGKRDINVRQAKVLAHRFGVSPGVFI